MIRLLTLAGGIALALPAHAQPSSPPMSPETPQSPRFDAPGTVTASFSTYDTDRSGQLDQMEFARWARALMAASPNHPPMSENDLRAWSMASFVRADEDRSGSIDKAEMSAFVSNLNG